MRVSDFLPQFKLSSLVLLHSCHLDVVLNFQFGPCLPLLFHLSFCWYSTTSKFFRIGKWKVKFLSLCIFKFLHYIALILDFDWL